MKTTLTIILTIALLGMSYNFNNLLHENVVLKQDNERLIEENQKLKDKLSNLGAPKPGEKTIPFIIG